MKKKSKYTRSSKHNINKANIGKLIEYELFRVNYSILVKSYVDYLWSQIHILKLDIPKMLESSICNQVSNYLTARLRQCAAKQACSMVKAATKKRRKQLFKLKELQREGKSTKYLQRKIDLFALIKPSCSNIKDVYKRQH